MNEFDITDPRFVREDQSMIDVIWNHPTLGPTPYTAVASSGTAHGQRIWDGLRAGTYGPIAPFVPIDLAP